MGNRVTEKNKKSPVIVVLNIIIGILLAAVVLAGVGAAAEFADSHSYHVDAENYLWRVEDEDYSGVLRLYYNDSSRTAEEEEYYAIAEYTEAAFFYYAFSREGGSMRARKYQERMEQAAARMGEFYFVKDKIDSRLRLTNGQE